jgi:hypothetical protein
VSPAKFFFLMSLGIPSIPLGMLRVHSESVRNRWGRVKCSPFSMFFNYLPCFRWHQNINIEYVFDMMLEHDPHLVSTIDCIVTDNKIASAGVSFHPNMITMLGIWFLGWLGHLLMYVLHLDCTRNTCKSLF